MKKVILFFFKQVFLIVGLYFAFTQQSNAQIIMSTANCTISSNEVQMDILVKNTGTIDLHWNACVLRMTVPAAMLPAGTQTYTFNYMGGSDFPLGFPVAGNNSWGANYTTSTRLLTWTTGNTNPYNNLTCSAPLISPGQTKTIGRFSFKISSSNFVPGAAANFVWHTTTGCVVYQGCVPTSTAYNLNSLRTLINPCTLTVPATLTSTYTSTNIIVCNSNIFTNGSITITAAGGTPPYSYNWTGPNGYTGVNTASVTNLTAGNYSVSVTDANNQAIASFNNIYISANNVLHLDAVGGMSTYCNNTSGYINLDGHGGVGPYVFSLDGTSFQSAAIFGNLTSGPYIAYMKDANGCTATASVTIFQKQFIVSPIAKAASSCIADGSIEIYMTGGLPDYRYSLDNLTYQSSNKFLNLAAGIYTTYVRDHSGCIASKTVTVPQIAAPSVTARYTNSSTCVNDGTIQANDPTGGVAPFTYSLNGTNFQAGKSFAGLASGTYTLTAKDSKGCLATTSVTIALNQINVTSYAWSAGSCAATNGKIQLFLTGGTGPYTYSLDGVTYQNSPLFNNLMAGTYSGFVKDSKGCVGTKTGIVVGPFNCPPTFAANYDLKQNIHTEKTIVLNAYAYPNPSDKEFTLLLEGYNNKEKILITVIDMLGRKVYQTEGSGKQQYKFGENFIAGMYVLQVLQGSEKRNIKLIKE
ncbi:MAG: T9SS type A sorting domain-containing protein [Ferruginibacter sp.]